MPREELLSVAEVSRLVDVAVSQLGIEEVRLTGGEPWYEVISELIVATIRSRHPGLPIALSPPTASAWPAVRRASRTPA